MFSPTPQEEANVPDLFTQLLAEGRKLMRTPEARNARIKEQQEESAARALLAAQRAMERFQWRPRASVALINRNVCSRCGTGSASFAGFGVSMFRNADNSERLVMSGQLDPAFPRETHFTDSVTAACMECVELSGFSLEHLDGKA